MLIVTRCRPHGLHWPRACLSCWPFHLAIQDEYIGMCRREVHDELPRGRAPAWEPSGNGLVQSIRHRARIARVPLPPSIKTPPILICGRWTTTSCREPRSYKTPGNGIADLIRRQCRRAQQPGGQGNGQGR